MDVLSKYLFVSLLFLLSCHADEREEYKKSNVDFKEISIESVHKIMFGKWEILEICGGIAGCVEVENFYYLFEKEKQTIYNEGKIREKPVLKWRKNEKGCEVLLGDEDEQSIILEKIVNDTLYFSSVSGAGTSVFVYTGIKVD